jgi:hypothetical protein
VAPGAIANVVIAEGDTYAVKARAARGERRTAKSPARQN